MAEADAPFLLSQVRRRVGASFDMSHFTPKYMPWDERLCAVPDGDLFDVLRTGEASVSPMRSKPSRRTAFC